MRSIARPARWVALLLLAACLAGCKSENEGKIVGKWRVNSAVSDVKRPPLGTTVHIDYEFTADNRVECVSTVTVGGQTERTTIFTAKYKLGPGNSVNLMDISPPIDGMTSSTERINITGDHMSISSGTKKGKPLMLNRVTDK